MPNIYRQAVHYDKYSPEHSIVSKGANLMHDMAKLVEVRFNLKTNSEFY